MSRAVRKHFIALIIPAYNESMVIAHTIESAIKAGLAPQHIYVVDDQSNDGTAEIARSLVGAGNVVSVRRSGKGLAIYKLNRKMNLSKQYLWIHIADADGEFDKKYFSELRKHLRQKYAAATGYVASLPGKTISIYRAFEYTIGMDIIRRFQAMTGLITIIPGPTSVFRADVFDKLDFRDNVLCEDFDVTLQVHHQKLGKIQFIPTAIARTQDPASYNDFIKQITRWNRGVLQLLYKHHIGSRFAKIDAYLLYQVAQNILFAFLYGVWVPFVILTTGNLMYVALLIIADIMLMFILALFATLRSKRWAIMAAFPLIYVLRWVNLFVFVKSFVEVIILEKYRHVPGIWETAKRRKQKSS